MQIVSCKLLELNNRRFSGKYDDNLTFEFGEGTEVVDGCGATFMDEFWYFGGWYEEQQVNIFNFEWN